MCDNPQRPEIETNVELLVLHIFSMYWSAVRDVTCTCVKEIGSAVVSAVATHAQPQCCVAAKMKNDL